MEITMNNVKVLPIWKKHSTADEWLMEIAAMARDHPERFTKAVIVIQETKDDGVMVHRYYDRGVQLLERIGLLEVGKMDALKAAER